MRLMIYQGLDTYKALAAAGILPSTTQTYTSDDIQAALTTITGSAVVLGCRGGRLDEAVSKPRPWQPKSMLTVLPVVLV
jgi:Ribonuclease T2 family